MASIPKKPMVPHNSSRASPSRGQCDEQILPALYAWVGAAFDATPTQLGNLALARAVVQALTSPLGGIASE